MKRIVSWLTNPYFYLPVGQITLLAALVMYIMDAKTGDVYGALVVSALLSIAINVLLFSTVRDAARKTRRAVELSYLSRQSRSNTRFETLLEKQNQELEALRRETEDKLVQLLENGGNIVKKPFASDMRINPVVDALLHSKEQECTEKGIMLDIQAIWPERQGISDVTLVCALSNMLDNAMEACKDMDMAVIRLRIAPYLEYIAIQMENPSAPATVKDMDERGMGMHILEDIANRHRGYFSAGEKGGAFRTELILSQDSGEEAAP